jgi:general secretion pathway protein J
MNKSTRAHITGFTLLEILIAMAILAIVLSIIYSSFTKTLAEMNATESEADIYQMARIALERIGEDLECSLLLKTEGATEEEAGASETIEFIGKNEEIDGSDADSLIFLSTKHISLDKEDQYSGLTRIAFYVKQNEEEEGLILYRSDTPEFEDAPEEKTGGVILCDNLFSVNFTYYDTEGDEYDQWNSSEGDSKDLPAMVSIQLHFINESTPEEPLKFETGVALPMARDKYGKEGP